MSPRLLPCPACARHVKIIESFCPFCGATLPLSLRGAGSAPLPRKRLGRAAIAAFGAAALIGCGGDDATTTDTGTGDTGTADSAMADGSTDTGTADSAMPDATAPDTAVAPAYGAPPPVDSGTDTLDDDGAVMNLYGAPPEP